MGSYVGWMLAGAVVGVAAGQSMFALVAGIAVGWLIARLAAVSRQIDALRVELGRLSPQSRRAVTPTTAAA